MGQHNLPGGEPCALFGYTWGDMMVETWVQERHEAQAKPGDQQGTSEQSQQVGESQDCSRGCQMHIWRPAVLTIVQAQVTSQELGGEGGSQGRTGMLGAVTELPRESTSNPTPVSSVLPSFLLSSPE